MCVAIILKSLQMHASRSAASHILAWLFDRDGKISVYILSAETLFDLYPNGKTGLTVYWAMSPAATRRYRDNQNIYRWELTHKIERWWPGHDRLIHSAGHV